ncbi:MAG: 3-ketoacyl-ACP reductase [Paracoccaceae bacterium]
MTDLAMHQRLLALDAHLGDAELRLADQSADPAHVATARELRRRYTALSHQVAKEEITAEAQGHHVTDLEHAVRMWLDRLSNETA